MGIAESICNECGRGWSRHFSGCSRENSAVEARDAWRVVDKVERELATAQNDLIAARGQLREQDDLINRLATVARTATEYIAAHPCDHPSGCAYRDDLNRSISYAPGGKP